MSAGMPSTFRAGSDAQRIVRSADLKVGDEIRRRVPYPGPVRTLTCRTTTTGGTGWVADADQPEAPDHARAVVMDWAVETRYFLVRSA